MRHSETKSSPNRAANGNQSAALRLPQLAEPDNQHKSSQRDQGDYFLAHLVH